MQEVLNRKWENGYYSCSDCGGLIEENSEWLGEDKNSKGWFKVTYQCEDCGNWIAEIQPE